MPINDDIVKEFLTELRGTRSDVKELHTEVKGITTTLLRLEGDIRVANTNISHHKENLDALENKVDDMEHSEVSQKVDLATTKAVTSTWMSENKGWVVLVVTFFLGLVASLVTTAVSSSFKSNTSEAAKTVKKTQN